MPPEPSFGNLSLESAVQGSDDSEKSSFRIAILGDFTARANRGELASSADIAQRKSIKVEYDTLEETLEELELKLRLPIAGGSSFVGLEFQSLDDFHPDPIYKQVDLFEDLDDLAESLKNGSEDAQAKVLDWATDASVIDDSKSPSAAVQIPAAETFDDFQSIQSVAAVGDDADELGSSDLIKLLVGNAVQRAIQQSSDDSSPEAEQLGEMVSEVSENLMRQIMHHADFQALESAWRSVNWLLKRIYKGSKLADVVLLDISAEEFAADLSATEELDQTGLFKSLVSEIAEAADPLPLSIIVGLYHFETNSPCAQLLGRMSKIAARVKAPFLTGGDPKLLISPSQLDDLAASCWEEMRKLEESKFMGLVVPGFLARLPFGENSATPEKFQGEEFSLQESTAGCLWANGAMAAACLLAQSYFKEGWGFKPGGLLNLPDMPLHVYQDDEDESQAISTQAHVAAEVNRAAGGLGFMVLLPVRGRDEIQLGKFLSTNLENCALAGKWAQEDAGPPPDLGLSMPGGTSTSMMGTKSSEIEKKYAPPPPPPKSDDDDDDDFGMGDDDDDDFGASDDSDDDLGMGGDDNDDFGLGSDDDDDDLSSLLDDDGDDDDLSSLLDDDSDDDDLSSLLDDDSDDTGDDTGDDTSDDDDLSSLLDDDENDSDSDDDVDLDSLLDDDTDDATDDDTDDDDLSGLLDDDSSDDDELDDDLAALLDDDETSDDDDDLDMEALLDDDDEAAAAAADDETDLETGDDDTDDIDLDSLLDESDEETSLLDDLDLEESETMDEEIDEDIIDQADDDSEIEPELSSLMADDELDQDDELDETESTPVDPALLELLESSNDEQLLIDFQALLEPIEGDEPHGGSVPFDLREKLTEARKEIDPSSYADDDPRRPDDVKKADWTAIISMCTDALTDTSKDLLLVARMTEAMTKTEGFAGLRDSIRLMRLMVGICWDRINPLIEDEDDLEVRAAPFNWLDDPDRGAVFPTTIRSAPVVISDHENFSLSQWKQLQEGGSVGMTQEMFDRAVMATERSQCQQIVNDLEQSLDDLQHLSADLDQKIGEEAPSFHVMRPAIEECLVLANQILEKKGPAIEESEAGGAIVASGSGGGSTIDIQVASRDEAYRRLKEAANVLQTLEPHSPIPYLVHRAVELGSLPFPLLMKALIRDSSVLDELSREFGINTESDDEEEL